MPGSVQTTIGRRRTCEYNLVDGIKIMSNKHFLEPRLIAKDAVLLQTSPCVDFDERVRFVELLNCEQFTSETMIEDEVDIVEIHKDSSKHFLSGQREHPKNICRGRVEIDIARDEACRRVIFRNKAGYCVSDIAKSELGSL